MKTLFTGHGTLALALASLIAWSGCGLPADQQAVVDVEAVGGKVKINAEGQVVGMITAGNDRTTSTGGPTVGFAVPIDTALAVVDLLLDREEAARARPELKDWGSIEGVLVDVRGSSGGYDPNILTTFLRGQWSAGDYRVVTREGSRVVPPEYKKLPAALLVNSGTASAGEALALKFRAHAIGPIVGEQTAGMLSGGAATERLSDGSTLWISRRAIRDLEGQSYEGRGVPPDVAVADRPGPEGAEEDIVEAGIRALSRAAAPQ